MRIWWQSFLDPVAHSAFVDPLQEYIAQIAGPGVSVELHGMWPPDVAVHRLTEFRCSVQVVRNAVEAERQGYDAFVVAHFQDSGLYEARSTVGIPVLGLGESAMLFACLLGQKIGLVTIDPVFVPFHEEQVVRYRLEQRVVAVRAIQTSVADFMRAFAAEDVREEVRRQFVEQVRPLVEAGVEVIVPAGGLPTLLFARHGPPELGGAAVVNGIRVVLKHAELAVELRREGGGTSRVSTFALPPEQAIRELLEGPRVEA